MKPAFDHRDDEILAECKVQRNRRKGPRLGDFVEMPDGRTMRFSHDWGDDVQISEPTRGSFYLFRCGGASFSGGLEPAIDKAKIIDTKQTKLGMFWFFHHNHACAGNGVYFEIPCRVFRYTGGFTPSKLCDQWTGKPYAPAYL